MDIFDYFDRGCKTSNHGNHGLSSRIIGALGPLVTRLAVKKVHTCFALLVGSWKRGFLILLQGSNAHYGY